MMMEMIWRALEVASLELAEKGRVFEDPYCSEDVSQPYDNIDDMPLDERQRKIRLLEFLARGFVGW